MKMIFVESELLSAYFETFEPPFFLDLSFRPDFLKINHQGYNRPSKDIISDIESGLRRLTPLRPPEISIQVVNQVVTLQGLVASLKIARYIENMTSRVLGVRSVENKLQIYRTGAHSAAAPLKTSSLGKAPNDKLPDLNLDLPSSNSTNRQESM